MTNIERFGKLKDGGCSRDNKRTFILDDRVGWKSIRIEIDTDDCDREHAMAFKEAMVNLWNAQ